MELTKALKVLSKRRLIQVHHDLLEGPGDLRTFFLLVVVVVVVVVAGYEGGVRRRPSSSSIHACALWKTTLSSSSDSNCSSSTHPLILILASDQPFHIIANIVSLPAITIIMITVPSEN